MQTGLGGPLGFGTTSLPRDDDGSHFVALGAIFAGGLRLGAQVHSGVWINTNGTLSFGGALAGYDQPALTGAAGPVIAVFAADVDTRLRGEGVESGVIWLHEAPGQLTVTWADVGFFRRNTELVNSFQVQIRAAGGQDADISLRYGAINWTSGDLDGGSDGLGGAAALAGVQIGGVFQEIAPSGNEAAWLSLSSGAEWQIAVRNGSAQITSGDAGGTTPPDDGDGGGDSNPPPAGEGAGAFTAQVIGRDGEAVAGLGLRLMSGDTPIAETSTQENGTFTFQVPAHAGPLRLEPIAGTLGAPAPDIMDVLSIFRMVAGAIPAGSFDADARLAADYNGNGQIDIFDVLALFRFIAGVPNAMTPRITLIEADALAEGFGPDPLKVPASDTLPGIDVLAMANAPPLTLVAILSGDVSGY